MMKVLVIGDHCTDVFVYGHAKRLSPEIPCPVLDYSHREEYPGMAGNVARNLESLGFEVDLICNETDIKKIRYVDVDSGYQFLRMDTPVGYKHWNGKMKIAGFPQKYDAVVIADYGKGFLETYHINTISQLSEIPVFIDTKMSDLRHIGKKAVVKINRKEYHAIEEKMERCHLIVTLGKDGAMYRGKTYPGFEVPVFDLMGAGDTFLAVLVWAMVAKEFPIKEAIEWANYGASLVVQKKGTAVVTEIELRETPL